MTLLAHHRSDLHASGLSDETIARAGIYSAPGRQVRDLLGYDAGAGMVFPYPSLNGAGDYVRVKLDKPGPDGKRYRAPKGQPNHLYVSRLIDPKVLNDCSVPIWITEGEKKALKACQEGLHCVGLFRLPTSTSSHGRGERFTSASTRTWLRTTASARLSALLPRR